MQLKCNFIENKPYFSFIWLQSLMQLDAIKMQFLMQLRLEKSNKSRNNTQIKYGINTE